MNDLIELFLTFAKVGAFTFGGGYAMISLIEDICVEKKKWITHDEMMDITVIAESTPGPIAINCATYVGYKRKKLLGGLYFGLRKLIKKKISPIMLICVSAVCGMIVYGLF